MKKYWPLLLIGGLLLAIICMSQYADSAKNRHQESTKQTKNAPVTESNNAKTGNDTQDAYKPPVWAKLVAWPDGVVAWSIILTLLAIVWQSIETRESANATKIGAEAALLNTEALIKAERPWFVPVMERMVDEYGATINQYRVRITNRGRTPGQLYRIDSCRLFASDPYKLPLPAVYNAPCYAPDANLFATDGSFTDRERLPGYGPDFMLSEPGTERGQFDFLVMYGHVTYVDMFTLDDFIQETRWCYMWNPAINQFTPCGPAEYNGYHTHPRPKPSESSHDDSKYGSKGATGTADPN